MEASREHPGRREPELSPGQRVEPEPIARQSRVGTNPFLIDGMPDVDRLSLDPLRRTLILQADEITKIQVVSSGNKCRTRRSGS
jgi:hypothetical protein